MKHIEGTLRRRTEENSYTRIDSDKFSRTEHREGFCSSPLKVFIPLPTYLIQSLSEVLQKFETPHSSLSVCQPGQTDSEV